MANSGAATTTSMGKTTVVCIIGSGHSGSTILDKAFGGHPAHFSLGEVTNFAQEFDHNALCGCGKWVKECLFWGPVLQDLNAEFGVHLPEDHAQFSLNYEQVLGGSKAGQSMKDSVLRLLGGKKETDPRVLALGKRTAAVYRAVVKHSGAKVLVDSSKSLGRYLALRQMIGGKGGEFDFRLVHLVRDGRAQLHSSKKDSYTVEVPQEDGTKVKQTFEMARKKDYQQYMAEWYRTNLKLWALRKAGLRPSLLVRHEDLCNHPEATLTRLARWAGSDFHPRMLQLGRNDAHMLCGNSSRLNATEIRPADDSWKAKLDPTLKAQFEKKSGWLNRQFGYR